ncbi:MAG: hypothetical protein QNM02_00970 [Acidimicrobiia bacterium]|nr:hypothetical protein [Acidimicrobiia bacterium]
MSDAPQSFGDGGDGGSRPNFLVRRLAFTALIVAAVAVLAIVAGRLIGDADAERTTVDVDTAWDTVVTVNQHTGRVTMSDPDGSGTEGLSTNTGRVTDAAMIDDTVFVAGARASVAVSLAGDRPRVEISDLLDGDITIARPSGTNELVMFSNGTNAVFMGSDPERLISTSVAVAAPGVQLSLDQARANVDGTAVLLPDPGNFQSVMLRFDELPATYLAGVPIAVDGERVATVQNVGGNATITVSDHDGERLAEFTTQPVLAAMLIDGGIVTVDRDGAIHLIYPSGDELIGTVDAAPVDSWVATTGDRLVVATAAGVAVIDANGVVRSSTDGAGTATTGPAPASTTPLRPGCLPLVEGENTVLLSNLRNGDPLADTSTAGTAVFTSADGCTAITSGSATVVLTADGRRVLTNDLDALLALSPDGSTIAVDQGGRLAVESVTTIDPDADAGTEADPGTDPDADAVENDADDDEAESEAPADALGAATPYVFFADL